MACLLICASRLVLCPLYSLCPTQTIGRLPTRRLQPWMELLPGTSMDLGSCLARGVWEPSRPAGRAFAGAQPAQPLPLDLGSSPAASVWTSELRPLRASRTASHLACFEALLKPNEIERALASECKPPVQPGQSADSSAWMPMHLLQTEQSGVECTPGVSSLLQGSVRHPVDTPPNLQGLAAIDEKSGWGFEGGIGCGSETGIDAGMA